MKELYKKYYSIILLCIFTFLSSGLLSYVYALTYPKIQEAYKKDFNVGLNKVLPKYTNDPYSDVFLVDNKSIYPAKDNSGKVIAYAIASSSSKGYGGTIDILLGVSDNGSLIGVTVVKHAETPGLGANVTKDKFLASFVGLSDEMKIKIKKDGGDVDQISGASISPRAVSFAVVDGLTFIKNNILAGAK